MIERDLAERLAAVEFFAGLSEDARRAVARTMAEMRHSPGKVLTEQGAEGAGFHLVLAGSAIVKVNDAVVATLTEGGSFGEISLLDGLPRSATVVAGPEGLRTAAISPLAFAPMLDDPSVVRPLLRVVVARLRAA